MEESRTTNGRPEDIKIVGGDVIPTKDTIKIPPEGALNITSSIRKELMDLKLVGEGIISKEDAEKLKAAEQERIRQAIRKAMEARKARKAKAQDAGQNR